MTANNTMMQPLSKPVDEYVVWHLDMCQQELSAVLLTQVQDPDDSSEIHAQFQHFKSKQAQLIADLQHRLDHLAGVIVGYDDQRLSLCISLCWHLQPLLQLMSSQPFHKAVSDSCSCLWSTRTVNHLQGEPAAHAAAANPRRCHSCATAEATAQQRQDGAAGRKMLLATPSYSLDRHYPVIQPATQKSCRSAGHTQSGVKLNMSSCCAYLWHHMLACAHAYAHT